MVTVAELFVYPVKGLSAQPLDRVALRPGKGFPHDRRFAFARPDGEYRPGTRAGLPKREFFALVSDHRLAGLDMHLDTETDVLTARIAGHGVLAADLSTEEGAVARAGTRQALHRRGRGGGRADGLDLVGQPGLGP